MSIVARLDEKNSQCGCMNSLRLRLRKYLELSNRKAPALEDFESVTNKLDGFPPSQQVAVTNISGDHAVVVLPIRDCPVCGRLTRSELDVSKYIQTYCKESAHNDAVNSYRAIKPDDFVKNLPPLFGILGIANAPIEQEQNVDGTYFFNSLQFLNAHDGYDVAGGKGDTKDFSMASCFGEAIERYFLTGSCSANNVNAAYCKVSHEAIDPVKDWGFPSMDNNPIIKKYSPTEVIGWTRVDCLTARNNKSGVLVPADMVYSPPRFKKGVSNISFGSTNGAASGANLEDSTTQSLLELIERDSFWYYMRGNNRPIRIDDRQLSKRILEIMRNNSDIHYMFELLPNPFHVPVVQVLASDRETGIQSRGTGAMFTLNQAIDRAFNESNQMFTSLKTGIDVSDDGSHMRSIWFNGEAAGIFPNIFNPLELNAVSKYISEIPSQGPLEELLRRFTDQKLEVYRKTLVRTSSFCVTKCLASQIATADPTYYSHSHRLKSYADQMEMNFTPSNYAGTLFM